MSNTLATITPHGWILALFIRDDGERLLLGDGYYEFKEEQRHFVANTYINDVVELQGTDGQLIAGQVRRSQAQPFDGYICDPTIDQATTEQKRRDFFLFFRKNHEYKVVYIFPNGDAIQRTGGYIVDAPEIREIIQRSPEYHVALAFEDVNYYTYAEAPDGSEKYTYEADLAPVFATDGGLLWDGKGMVSDSLSLTLNGINGDTFQQNYAGKNLLPPDNGMTAGGITTSWNSDGTVDITGTATGAWPQITRLPYALGATIPSGTQLTLSMTEPLPTGTRLWFREYSVGENTYKNHPIPNNGTSITFSISADIDRVGFVLGTTAGATLDIRGLGIMLEVGSTATDFEPFVGGIASPNPNYPQTIQTVAGSQTIAINGTNYPLDLGTIELCKLGTYQDRIYKDGSDWKIRKETGKVALSSITWQTYAYSLKRTDINPIANMLYTQNNQQVGVGLTEGFKIRQGAGLSGTAFLGYFAIDTNRIAFNVGTGGNDPTGNLYYALATPTETTITDQTLIAQLEAIRTALAGGGKITITPTGNNLAVKLDTTPTGTGGLIWEASSSGTPITVNIQGVDKAYPILEITGPAVDPVLTNITTGEEFFWTGTVPSGQTLRVDMRSMTATLNGANVFEFVSGSWVGFEPGPNTVRYTAASATYPAKIYYNEVVG